MENLGTLKNGGVHNESFMDVDFTAFPGSVFKP